MKIRNKTIYSEDVEYLKRVAEELDFLGRDYILDARAGTLMQIARPKRKVSKKKRKADARNKRAESAARNNVSGK